MASATATETVPVPRVRWDWIGTGWNLFLADWQIWVFNTVIFLFAMIIPIGMLTAVTFVSLPIVAKHTSILTFILLATACIAAVVLNVFVLSVLIPGMFRTAWKQIQGQQIGISDLFSGMDAFPRMFVVNLLTATAVFAGFAMCVLPAILVGGLLQFAGPLVAIGNLRPVEALKRSIDATKHDWLNFTVFALLVYLLAGAGANLCYVGLLATYPLMFTIQTAAYRDLFGTIRTATDYPKSE